MILIIKHIPIEGPVLIGEYFGKKKYDLVTVELGLGEKLPEITDGLQAVIILGGPMNVYEEEKYPHLRDEHIFIQELIARDIPTLGICLGAQLIAKASGALVKKASQKEIGFFKIKLTCDAAKDTVFMGLGGEIDVFQWHEDTFDVPSGGVLLAEGDTCRNQAFRVGSSLYGLQFHVEVDDAAIREWIKEYLDPDHELQRVMGGKMLADCEKYSGNLRATAEKICYNFEKLIADHKERTLV